MHRAREVLTKSALLAIGFVSTFFVLSLLPALLIKNARAAAPL